MRVYSLTMFFQCKKGSILRHSWTNERGKSTNNQYLSDDDGKNILYIDRLMGKRRFKLKKIEVRKKR